MANTTHSKLLEQRRVAKKRLPLFVVKESHYKGGRVKTRWRWQNGKHSKVRQQHSGRPAVPTPGYGSPRAVYGLDRTGFEKIVVACTADMAKLNPKTQGALLSSTLGARKKVALLAYAIEKKITILNVKDAAALSEKITQGVAARRKKRELLRGHKLSLEEEKKRAAAEREKKEKKEKEEAASKAKVDSVEEKITQAEEKRKEEQDMAQRTITKRQN